MEKVQNEKEVGRKFFGHGDFSLMCDWLNIKGNLESVKGSDGKTRVGAKYPNKKQAFSSMALYINKQQVRGSDLVPINEQGARNRYNNVMLKYKRAKVAASGTGWGLTQADQRAGILTIAAKMEKMCPCFARLDVIMDGQPEVNIAGNLFNASSIPNADGTMPVDILSSVGVDGVEEDSLADEREESSNFTTTPDTTTPIQDGQFSSQAAREQVIDLEQDSPPPRANPEPIPAVSARMPPPPSSPSLNGAVEEGGNEDTEFQSASTIQPDPTPTNPKPSRFSSGKKRPAERSSSFGGTFATSMESLSDGKLKGIVIRERALEAKLAAAELDRSVRRKNTQRQLEIDASKLKHEEKRLEHSANLEAKRLEQAQWSADRKLELLERKAKMQARISLMKINKHRAPEEIEKLMALMETDMD